MKLVSSTQNLPKLRTARFSVIKKSGFTLIEILVVTAILVLLMIAAMVNFLPTLGRGRDGRRKADLQRISIALEEYYNNKESYPPTLTCGSNTTLAAVLGDVPCDVITRQPYLYIADPVACAGTVVSPCRGYRLLTDLDYDQDPDIEKKGCTISFSGKLGCHQASGKVYDWGIAVGRTLYN